MLMIRLQRVGRKHEPVFRLVLTDSKNGPKSGKFLEILGFFDARKSEKAEFKIDRIKHWMSNGAKLSDTIHNLLVERKIIEGKKINVLPRKSPVVSEKVPEAPKTEAPKEEQVVEPKEEAPALEPEPQPENVEIVEEKVAEEIPV